eukprot:m.261117 g.261117  ORF g.261117 m.261117 type:complete len:684 (-) comp22745_c3_seq2:96-2147(-)
MHLKSVALLLVVALCGAAQAVAPKALAGPPSEFASHRIPDPSVGLLTSDTAMFMMVLSADGEQDTPKFEQVLMADSTTTVALAVFSPLLSQLQLSLTDPSGAAVDLEKIGVKTNFVASDDDEVNSKLTGNVYKLDNPMKGKYVFTATAPGLTQTTLRAAMPPKSTAAEQGFVLLYNDSPDDIATHLTHYDALVGHQVGLNTRMFDSVVHGPLVRGVVPAALRDVITTAELDVVYPDGHIEKTPMHDDGLHFDGEANDGAYGAQITPTVGGKYVLQAVLSGTNTAGQFQRTTQHFLQVEAPTISLTGASSASLHPLQGRVNLNVGVQDADPSKSYRVYAEVQGRNVFTGKATEVAWVSTITSSTSVRGKQSLTAELDLAWLARAQSVGPLTLQNVYVQDANSMVPVSQAASMLVAMPADVARTINSTVHAMLASGYKGEISKTMRQGHPPAYLTAPRNATNSGKLILLHGYCAKQNPFLERASDFTDALYFLDASQARPTDDFAKLVVEFAEKQGLTSYGLAGHSQGGMVSLHTLNFYHTGLDNAVGNRKIQTLASPFHGNSAIGAADTAQNVFGEGCGSLNSLSVDGAALWLSGITAETIAQLNYYYTQYDKGGLFGIGYCSMAMDLFLDKPNDGATENKRATLTGGTNRGLTLGQCHVKELNWPASFLDSSRNQEINANAAR